MIEEFKSLLFDHPTNDGCPYSVAGRIIAGAGWLVQIEQRVY